VRRTARTVLPLLFLLLWTACASSNKSVEVKVERDGDLPAIADLADPSAARVKGSVIVENDLGRRIRILLSVSEIQARGSVAPPLKPGKRIEITIPRAMWTKQILSGKADKKALDLTIKYAGKPKDVKASSAWTWVKFHTN